MAIQHNVEDLNKEEIWQEVINTGKTCDRKRFLFRYLGYSKRTLYWMNASQIKEFIHDQFVWGGWYSLGEEYLKGLIQEWLDSINDDYYDENFYRLSPIVTSSIEKDSKFL